MLLLRRKSDAHNDRKVLHSLRAFESLSFQEESDDSLQAQEGRTSDQSRFTSDLVYSLTWLIPSRELSVISPLAF